MKSRIVAVVVLSLISLVACTKPQGSTFTVLFHEAPFLTDQAAVDRDGTVVATIAKMETNRDNSVRFHIAAAPSQQAAFTRNLVFVVIDGRLQTAHLGGDAEPLPTGSRIMGFSSSKSLFWFKLRHVLGGAAATAAAMADEIDAAR